MPTIAPNWSNAVGFPLPQLGATTNDLTPTIYGSCESDRAVIAYLDQQTQLPETTRQERNYAANQRADLEKDLKKKGC
jgi:hypothetical protein